MGTRSGRECGMDRRALNALLERAGVQKDACEIVLEGADRGTPKEEPVPPIRFHMPVAFHETKHFSGKS